MYTIVKFSVFDDVLQRITVGFWGKFSFLEDFFRILQIPPLQKPKKRDKGGVSVAKGWDILLVCRAVTIFHWSKDVR